MVSLKEEMLQDAVWVDADRMGGIACFQGTRVPVEFLFDWLATGETLDYFLEQYPSVKKEQAQAVLTWSKLEICKEMEALETFAR